MVGLFYRILKQIIIIKDFKLKNQSEKVNFRCTKQPFSDKTDFI